MATSIRQLDILQIAKRDQKVTVDALAREFDVTVQTIRRDLSELADAGKLERVHGGAVLPSGVSNIGYEERRLLNEENKSAIARVCADRIPDGSSLFMNIGTSTEAVARELVAHRNLLVVTNNLNIANTLSSNHDCKIVVAGGELRRTDGGLVGNLTADMVKVFKFDFAIIGCSSLDPDGDLLDFDAREILVSQTAIERSRQVLVVADSSKFRRKAPITICSLRNVSTLFTDDTLPEGLPEKCERWGTEIVVRKPHLTNGV
ncbi:DeoR/GlpR family DNA-binding transcription regulator [Amaricoccus tamworthensis]|uniref:DeoR/GlpR family DNA-binding transcription regulator n=1 Tax=Amaricoccus tamworthensis TaxID=57002 RepID=UPI003C7D2B1F